MMRQITIRIPRLRTLLAILVLLGAVGVAGAVPLLRFLGRSLVREDTLRRADVIVVTAGGHPERILEAVDLFLAGRAQELVWVPERLPSAFAEVERRGAEVIGSSEFYRRVATQLGVPPDAIRILNHPVNSTHEEAAVLAQYLRAGGVRTVILVTSPIHSTRQCWIVEAFLGEDIELICRPSRYGDFDPDDWWRDRASARELVMEYMKMANYLLRERWTRPPSAWAPSADEPDGASELVR